MTRYILFLLVYLWFYPAAAQHTIRFCSWNLQNFGKSKHDTTIAFIAGVLKDFDVVAIQEVVAGPGGAQAVARLHDALNRTGAKWDYVVSDPTSSTKSGKERYAFLWKTSRLKKKGLAFLERFYEAEIEREPFLITFESEGRSFTLVSFHAVPKSKQPETEIKYFKCLPEMYPGYNLIFAGDFNCPESHTVFNPLKSMGYKPALTKQKTTLRQDCIQNDCLASEYDNVFYHPGQVIPVQSGIIPFHKQFGSVRDARRLSDHLPVFFRFRLSRTSAE